MALPLFQTQIRELSLLQTKWKGELDPLLAKPEAQSLILKEISLSSGSNTVNHLLGRKLQGWKVVRQRASASIYDTQDSNQMPELTLLLTSNNPVVVDLEVF